jgi:hypothetical protein
MEKRTKTWITIIVSVLAVIVMLGVAAIGGAAYWVYSHVHSETVAQETAGDTFTKARARFSGQQALIEIRDRDQVVVHRSEAAPVTGDAAKLKTLRAMVYDPDEGRMVNIDIPFWLLRLAPSGGRFSFLNDNGVSFDAERVRLTIEDLERRGPGLVLDQRDRNGSLVLVWTE